MRRAIVLVSALTFGVAGPRLTGPRSHAAGSAFAYEPPDGFVETRDPGKGREGTSSVRAWVYEEPGGKASSPRAVLHHSPKEMSVEEAELGRLAAEMPKIFEETGCEWVHRRHERRIRPDGARVGLIEGDCTQEVDLGAFGMPGQKVRLRKVQLIFPDDTGTSIVTASYTAEDASRWEPAFEATIARARGVAVRVPPAATWLYAVWGGAGAVLGWLLASLLKREPASPPPSKATAAKAKDADADEETDD